MNQSEPRYPSVLLAEDNPEHQLITRSLLEACGCRVIEAANGEEAVTLAKLKRPRMILLDLRMPVVDGLEAARRIRALPGMSGVPMVAYTAIYSYSLTELATAAGFDEYVKKPVTLEMMAQLLDRYLPNRPAGGYNPQEAGAD
ncbi:MAG TPA: response regulator [Pyrinomonadaceae bacterium]|nr:response regulator [Pyrinomonadaceae bacterium]